MLFKYIKKDYTELSDYEGTPYAYGVFKDLTNVSIGLLEGSKYCFKVSMVVDGAITEYPFGSFNEYNKFYFSSTNMLWYIDNVPGYDNSFAYDRFYGRLNNYIPTENGTAEIYIKRVAYGAGYIAENLTEGVLNINVSDYYNEEYALTLTPENPSNDRIYTFHSITAAYQGNYIATGYDPVTGDSTYIDNFSETKTITVSWTKANGNITPLGTYNITFKRNVKTVVRIKAEEITNNNAIRITKEETAMVNDDNEYSIEGGNVITTPIGQ